MSSKTVSSSSLPALTPGRRRWLLLGMLGLLHLLLVEGIESPVGRTMLTIHVGLFILWQPFVRAERNLRVAELAGIAVAIAAFVYWINPWVMIVWVMTLTGMVGGKVFFFAGRWTRLYYLLVLVYLIAVLLVLLVPQALPEPGALSGEIRFLAQAGLPALFLTMALLPAEQEAEGEVEVVDLVFSAFVFLMLAVLVLGSVSAMLLMKTGYVQALLYTLTILVASLLLMAWAWNPRAGFAGMSVFFSRYLLSIGLPFERWLHELAEHMQREDRPEKFLDEAIAGIVRLPWVTGGEWRAGGRKGGGGGAGVLTEFRHGALQVAVNTRQPLSPALTWHFSLMVQLLAEFYLAKLRAEELQQLSYVKAIHQTGARLTHDVKNLLQSLNALCLAGSGEGATPSPEYQALLRRQLPVIAQRLQQTLDKLSRPEMEGMQFVSARIWWQGLQGRYTESGIQFVPQELGVDKPIAATLFSSVAENLIENALAKRREAPDIPINAELLEGEEPALRVCDGGAAIPVTVVDRLFRAPVPSNSGLGIGLYQAGRHAEFYGYALRISANLPGNVCFELVKKVSSVHSKGEKR